MKQAMVRNVFFAVSVTLACSAAIFSQATLKPETPQNKEIGPIRSSAAYAEILLRKTELETDIASFADDYTESNPKMIDARFELTALTKDLDRLFAIKPSETTKLTEALGKLIVRKAQVEADLNRLLRTFNKDHPEVKRARRKAEAFATAVNDILG